jgi:hypothetical protein
MTSLSAVQVSVAMPALLLIGLTFVVWVLFYIERLWEMRSEGIAPQAVATRTQARAALKRTRAADNLQNLLEIPILFYALTAIVLLLDLRSAPFAPLAMAYVGLRVLHSAIHITYNRVVHRFTVYFVSTLVLIAMWFDVLRQVGAAWSHADV